MKVSCILHLVGVLIAPTLPLSAFAAEKSKPPAKAEKTETAAEWAELFGGASLPVVWQSAVAASEQIDIALAAHKFDGVAEWAETIHLASHALEDQLKIDDPERAKRLKSVFKQAAKVADDVLEAANHKELEKATDAQRRLKSALALAKIRMPKEVLEAPKQAVRFAKPSSVAHDAKSEHAIQKK